MLTRIQSCALVGLECVPVHVEVDVARGYPCFTIVGLPDTAINEARERIKSGINNSEITFPSTRRIIVNLAPADLRKIGPAYDLPMTVGILAHALELTTNFDDSLFIGELALDGTVRPVVGILSIAMYAKNKGVKNFFLPAENLKEAQLVPGVLLYPVKNIRELASHLLGYQKIMPQIATGITEVRSQYFYDITMKDVRGQEQAKRALEIAAAGGHNVLLSGSPGAGKTLLARALPSILPDMTPEEMLEVTKIYSVSGLLSASESLISVRPFRSPHHSSSAAALVGGGKFPRPGEISLAHRGVLFLDEFAEFPRAVLENLRQPLEDGVVSISRAQATLTFPARFMLIASQNPCPCGYADDPDRECTCSAIQVSNYKKKISGPILDRIDMHIDVPKVAFEKLSGENRSESSESIRERVKLAREAQIKRFSESTTKMNAEMKPREIHLFCKLDTDSIELLKLATTRFHLSARVYFRVLKLARTIADLACEPNISKHHIAEALQYRTKEQVE